MDTNQGNAQFAAALVVVVAGVDAAATPNPRQLTLSCHAVVRQRPSGWGKRRCALPPEVRSCNTSASVARCAFVTTTAATEVLGSSARGDELATTARPVASAPRRRPVVSRKPRRTTGAWVVCWCRLRLAKFQTLHSSMHSLI